MLFAPLAVLLAAEIEQFGKKWELNDANRRDIDRSDGNGLNLRRCPS
jgi:hypothetical protein